MPITTRQGSRAQCNTGPGKENQQHAEQQRGNGATETHMDKQNPDARKGHKVKPPRAGEKQSKQRVQVTRRRQGKQDSICDVHKERTQAVTASENCDSCYCGSEHDEGGQWIYCDSCTTWWHNSCAKLADKTCTFLVENDLDYICAACILNGVNTDKVTRTKPVSNILESVTASLKEVTKKLDGLLGRNCNVATTEVGLNPESARATSEPVGEELFGIVDNLSTRGRELTTATTDVESGEVNLPTPDNPTNNGKESTPISVEDYIENIRRKSNIILHNVPEPAGINREDRLTHDREFTQSIARELGIENLSIRKTTRLGSISPGKNRLLLVTLYDTSDRYHLLKEAKLLNHSEQYSNIFIAPDLSRKERETSRRQREERRQSKTNHIGGNNTHLM